MKRCDAILITAIGCAMVGGLGGVLLANGAAQMLVHALLGVWGGAIVGGLLGAVGCSLFAEGGEDDGRAGRDLRLESPQKLRPARP